MDPVAIFLDEQSRAGTWPGASWVIAERGRVVSSGAVGLRAVVPEPLPARQDTVYDLASLTKPLVTAPLLAILAEEKALDLEAPASSLLPGLACDRAGRPTLMDLALHRAGLPAWRPFYRLAKTPDQVLNSIMNLEPEAPCGARVMYSDPGYILLGEALRRASGQALDALFRERIGSPLRLATMVFCPPTSWRDRIAPTERGNRYEGTLAESLGDPLPMEALREGLIHGEVHDGNAFALGGVAGHAGLFGDAADVARLAGEFLGAGRGLFGARSIDLFRVNATPGLGQGRTLGWKRALPGAIEADGVLSPDSFGHNGFTGTSVWIDPRTERIYVLLTNRIHPEVRPLDMNARRRRFHEVAQSVS